MSAFAIRQATAADAGAIADLIALNDPRDMVSEISRDERRDRFHEYLSSGQNVSFLAEADSQLVGELSIALRHPDPSEIGFGVHPGWRRRGVATKLLEHAVSWADANDIHKLTAQVMSHNAPALGLLQQHGFAEEGYLVNQFRRKSGGANDAVLLARVSG
ncbi:MAG TPA: GNAT family N-acetyltransferase [Gaiellaceae bacterium]|jgi:ribosomal protein S18 acetylase RimI-like enzyme